MLTFALSYFGSITVVFLQDSIGSDFNDLGRKLLGGFIVAVVFAITFAVVRLRLRDKNPPKAFISVTNLPEKSPAPGASSRPADDVTTA